MTRHTDFDHLEDPYDRDCALATAYPYLTADKYCPRIGWDNAGCVYVELYPQLDARGDRYIYMSRSESATELAPLVKGLAWELFAVTAGEVDFLLSLYDTHDSELYEAMRDMYQCVSMRATAMPLPELSLES
jgi:hypothetical protein